MLRLITLLLSLAFVTNPSFAAERKRISVGVKERKREKKAQKTPSKVQRSALFTVKVEKKLIKDINRTVKFLKKTARSLPKGSQQRFVIQDKILNLYMENATYTQNLEERNYENAWNAWEARGGKGREPRISQTKNRIDYGSLLFNRLVLF